MLLFLLELLRGLFFAGYLKGTSFPKPLSAAEVRAAVATHLTGDEAAREKLVLSLRFGLCGGRPLTQQEVADRIGISRSYISRIEKKAVQKMRLGLAPEEDGKKGL